VVSFKTLLNDSINAGKVFGASSHAELLFVAVYNDVEWKLCPVGSRLYF